MQHCPRRGATLAEKLRGSKEDLVRTTTFINSFKLEGSLVFNDESSMAVVDVEVLAYVHRNRRFIRDGDPGRPPRLSCVLIHGGYI